MKARGSFACLALVAVALAMASAPGAAAKPGYYVVKRSGSTSITLPESNGYHLDIERVGAQRVFLSAFDFTRSATYSAPATARGNRVAARFGRLGHVSVIFHPNGPPEPEQLFFGDDCKGREPSRQEGFFVGSISFRGERGFVHIRRRRAHGTIYRGYRLVCKRRGRNGSGKPEIPSFERGYSLAAVPQNQAGAPWFSVYREDPNKHSRIHWSSEEANYLAVSTEHLGQLTIDRSASATAAPETFAVEPLDAAASVATVAPPPPFSGSARYERQPDGSSTWVGNLAVDLPGLGSAPLATPAYAARLCGNLRCACPSGKCIFFVSASSRRKPNDSSGLQRPTAVPQPLPLPGPAWRAALRSATLR